MRILLMVFLTLLCVVGRAQYNSDYKTVARKHIKSAIAYDIQNDGDTFFYRYNYDRQGGVTSFDMYCWSEYYVSLSFDNTGREIGTVEMYPAFPADTNLDRDEYIRIIGRTISYDTLYYQMVHYGNNGQVDYMKTMSKNPQHEVDVYWTSGDSAFSYYSNGHGSYVQDGFSFKVRVDSIPNSEAEIHYLIYEGDTTLSSITLTTHDRHGQIVQAYYVRNPYFHKPLPVPAIKYNPFTDSNTTIQLALTQNNEYRLNGSLKRTTRFTCNTNQTEIIDYPKSRLGLNSLEDIKKFGTVIYEYY